MATEEEKQRRKNLGIGSVTGMTISCSSYCNVGDKQICHQDPTMSQNPVGIFFISEEPSVNVTNVSNSSNTNVTKCPEERKISLEHKICDLLPDMKVSLRLNGTQSMNNNITGALFRYFC